MKYRLIELLRCIRCHGDLSLSAAQVQSSVGGQSEGKSFRAQFCHLDGTFIIPGADRCSKCSQLEIENGTLVCQRCGQNFPIVQAVPWLLDTVLEETGRLLANTAALYGRLWTSSADVAPSDSSHLSAVEEALGETVVRGKIGLDAGSGKGDDTYALASRCPAVEIISLDISDGIYVTQQRVTKLQNVHCVRASVLKIPLKSEACDFVYSYGVLHHTTDPLCGLREIVRVLKPGGRTTVYLYEDHADNPLKALSLKIVAAMRRVTTRLNPRVLSALCYLLSPAVVVIFSIPAQIMFQFRATQRIAAHMPFNFGTTFLSVHGDLLDRFGAPIEVRYSRESLQALLRSSDLTSVCTNKLRTVAGWVARGVKPEMPQLH